MNTEPVGSQSSHALTRQSIFGFTIVVAMQMHLATLLKVPLISSTDGFTPFQIALLSEIKEPSEKLETQAFPFPCLYLSFFCRLSFYIYRLIQML
jgi:hypothetical protein